MTARTSAAAVRGMLGISRCRQARRTRAKSHAADGLIPIANWAQDDRNDLDVIKTAVAAGTGEPPGYRLVNAVGYAIGRREARPDPIRWS